MFEPFPVFSARIAPMLSTITSLTAGVSELLTVSTVPCPSVYSIATLIAFPTSLAVSVKVLPVAPAIAAPSASQLIENSPKPSSSAIVEESSVSVEPFAAEPLIVRLPVGSSLTELIVIVPVCVILLYPSVAVIVISEAPKLFVTNIKFNFLSESIDAVNNFKED